MKNLGLTTSEFSEIALKIAEPVANLAEDEKVISLLPKIQKFADSESENSGMGFIFLLLRDVVPILLGKHKEDTFAILSVLCKKDVKELENQDIMQTLQDIKNVGKNWNTVIDFFQHATSTEKEE